MSSCWEGKITIVGGGGGGGDEITTQSLLQLMKCSSNGQRFHKRSTEELERWWSIDAIDHNERTVCDRQLDLRTPNKPTTGLDQLDQKGLLPSEPFCCHSPESIEEDTRAHASRCIGGRQF